jgi:hypothetical protein
LSSWWPCPFGTSQTRLVTAVGRSLLHVGCTPFLVPRTGQLAVLHVSVAAKFDGRP